MPISPRIRSEIQGWFQGSGSSSKCEFTATEGRQAGREKEGLGRASNQPSGVCIVHMCIIHAPDGALIAYSCAIHATRRIKLGIEGNKG